MSNFNANPYSRYSQFSQNGGQQPFQYQRQPSQYGGQPSQYGGQPSQYGGQSSQFSQSNRNNNNMNQLFSPIQFQHIGHKPAGCACNKR